MMKLEELVKAQRLCYVGLMTQTWDQPLFTCNYSQPESYRFSLDSILLAKAVIRDAPQVLRDGCRVLDLCAGCGVIGLELSFLSPWIRQIDFIEIQSAYRTHFEKNLLQIPHREALHTRWLEMNYLDLQSAEFGGTYDLIVCNPPYFEARQGLLPPDHLKARSRFFLDGTFGELWLGIRHSLKNGGEAYVLVRDQQDHGQKRDPTIQEILGKQAEIVQVEDLRGTSLYRVRRL